MQRRLEKPRLQDSEPRGTTATLRTSTESRLNSEWNIFPGFTTLQLCDKISDLLSSMGQTPETFTGRILCQCSMTSPVTEEATKMNVWQMPESSKYLREDLVFDNGHLLTRI